MFTATATSAMFSGAVLWAMVWLAAEHVDEVPYVRDVVSTEKIKAWINDHKQLALIITEIVNMFLHGLGSPTSIAFNLGGTLVNAAVIFGLYPTYGVLKKPLRRWTETISTQFNKWADQLEAREMEREAALVKEAA